MTRLWGTEFTGKSIQTYKDDSSPQSVSELVAEIDRFKAAHPHDLNEAFMARHGFDLDPQLWGHDMDSFFSLLASLVKP